ncbi:O-acetyl-ADP-ribose deacetylase [Nakamurella sp. YIM 132087]|uniref:O-acetyl-ADP-ribose deacetylase n=1 Tax=Nakamurella alba TaxID=2665158 RepID=A0A7K1FEN9_9ACTN|nr:O-acetyl-ADP-ribose deacetylase [Nakamurella alba]MTD12572.1 O-acetyl-ADP-ribose deacetylase [Nakamurella alba]
MEITLATGDITTFDVDAVVNAANSGLAGGGGVDGAIHRAGGPAIMDACRELRRTEKYRRGLPTGQAVATTGGKLQARWVIHTVGPVHNGDPAQTEQLRDCYRNSLAVADEIGARTVAFALISAGVYGWPKRDAIVQALTALRDTPSKVVTATLVLFDPALLAIAEDVAGELLS